MFLHAGLVRIAAMRKHVIEHRKAKGIGRLGRVIDLAEKKTESAMETRLRMLLVLAGLPRPKVQIPIHDDDGRFLARQRQNRLIGAGFRILRFTAPDVYGDPESVVMQVRHGLAARG
jgi:hypothetical protein